MDISTINVVPAEPAFFRQFVRPANVDIADDCCAN
jgi:hypothetical protein